MLQHTIHVYLPCIGIFVVPSVVEQFYGRLYVVEEYFALLNNFYTEIRAKLH